MMFSNLFNLAEATGFSVPALRTMATEYGLEVKFNKRRNFWFINASEADIERFHRSLMV